MSIERPQWEPIVSWLPPGANVWNVGCDGTFARQAGTRPRAIRSGPLSIEGRGLLDNQGIPPGRELRRPSLGACVGRPAWPGSRACPLRPGVVARGGFDLGQPEQRHPSASDHRAKILDSHESRTVIECDAVVSLAGCLSIRQADRIEDISDEWEASAARGDMGRCHELDLASYVVLAALHGNAEMERASRQLRDKMHRPAGRMHRAHPERLVVNAARHRGSFRGGAFRQGR